MATNHSKYINSTGTHYISNSGKDENNAYTGGKAGDQSGHEWELKAWYNRPWTVVLRFLDQAVAETIARLGIDAALNNLIGYDQNQRNTYWTQLKAAGYDPSKINVACEEDCTAGVSANVKAAGFIHGIKALQDVSICSSRNMRSVFTKAGFVALTDSKYLTSTKYLLPGDILLYENHHAATNITVGSAVRNSWKPGTAKATSWRCATTSGTERFPTLWRRCARPDSRASSTRIRVLQSWRTSTSSLPPVAHWKAPAPSPRSVTAGAKRRRNRLLGFGSGCEHHSDKHRGGHTDEFC